MGVNTVAEIGTILKRWRTLFVAKSWPGGADQTVLFTTITAALTQASLLAPLPENHGPALSTKREPDPLLFARTQLLFIRKS
jgi:hypothetical protein